MRKNIIVIGGGFAGVTAARDLSQLSYRVTILEARDRIGGRTHRRKFAGTDVEVETGGAWFAGPKQAYAHREIVRHGLRYKPDPAGTTFGHLVGGKRIETPLPIEPELGETAGALFGGVGLDTVGSMWRQASARRWSPRGSSSWS